MIEEVLNETVEQHPMSSGAQTIFRHDVNNVDYGKQSHHNLVISAMELTWRLSCAGRR